MPMTFTRGAIAGAVGTLALDASTYADMALRGRPPSEVPAKTVDALAARRGTSFGEDPERAGNRA